MRRDIINGLAIAFVILAIGIAVISGTAPDSAIGGSTPTATPVAVQDVEIDPVTESDRLDPEFRLAFMEGCTEEGSSVSQCSCMFEYLDHNFTNDEIFTFVEALGPDDELPPEIYDAVMACM